MANFRIFRDSAHKPGHLGRAAAAGAVLAGLALAANAGRLAETPAAAAAPALALIGPGKLGELRAQPFDRPGRGAASLQRLDAMAAAALAGSPLSHEPFMAVAAGKLRDGKALTATDEARLREALRRNPRSREARIMLMRRAIAVGDLRGAVDQIAGLSQLSSEAAGVLLTGLGKALRSQSQLDQAMAGLKTHPELYKPFFTGFVQTPRAPALTVRAVAALPPAALADRDLRAMAIAAMVDARAFAAARAMWGAGQGAEARGLVHSPDFADAKAPPPFNWELAANETGAAEREPAGGLIVDYYGRRPGRLVSQLLTLRPGTYAATARYATLDGVPGAMALTIACAGGGPAMASAPLAAKPGPEQALRLSFTVPASGCGGQVIAVSGRVQEMRNAQQVSLRSIAVSESGQP
ncbi:MAG: hypothetical protein RIQ46_1941 [Pseudomonadota bacterium]